MARTMIRRTGTPMLLLISACVGTPPDVGAPVDDLPVLTAIEDLRVGSVEDPDEGFACIADVALGPDGLIYALEVQDQQVRVYDDTGTRVRAIGRRGEGPGEFTGARFLGLKGDTLWVSDQSQRRVTLLSPISGEAITTFSTGTVAIDAAPGLLVRVSASELREDGLLNSRFTTSVAGRGAIPDSSLTIPNLVFDRRGDVVDTAGFEVVVFPELAEPLQVGGRRLYTPEAPSDTPLFVRFPVGAAVVERAASATGSESVLTVFRVGDGGDTLYSRRFGYSPKRLESPFVDTLIWRWYGAPELVAMGFDSAMVERAFRESVDLPAWQSPVSHAVAGEDGSLWLRREDDGEPTLRWIVLDAEGAPSGAVDLPRRAFLLLARRDLVFAQLRDDLGVPWLVRYRIGD